jgi:hypothetical protein
LLHYLNLVFKVPSPDENRCIVPRPKSGASGKRHHLEILGASRWGGESGIAERKGDTALEVAAIRYLEDGDLAATA